MAATGGLAFSSSSLLRFHRGALVTINRRSSLIQIRRHGAVSLKSIPSSSSFHALGRLNTPASAGRYTRENSSIVVIGVSVHSAPVEMREKLAIVESEWPRAIEELCKLHHIEEAAVLSTCNRLEIYVLALSQHRGVLDVTDWMSKSSGVPVSEIHKHRVLLYNSDAIEHLFEVSSGLDSLVLGEGQILAQVKQVAKMGQGVVGFGRIISGLFKKVITVGKQVRSETSIAVGAMSVSSAAVELALMKLSESSSASSLTAARVLVVGAGKMGRLVIKHLVAKGCKRMVVVNRSEQSVAAIAKEMKEGIEISYKPMSNLYDCATEADLVFTCTASEKPLFLKEDVGKLPLGSSRLFIDISVPRNVGSCVDALETARVYNVDDLKQVVEANKKDREREVTKARAIIYEGRMEFQDWIESLATVPAIKNLRASMERHRVSGLEKCLSKFGDGITKEGRKAIEDYGWYMSNMFLRWSVQHLRCGDRSNKRSQKQTPENMHKNSQLFKVNSS